MSDRWPEFLATLADPEQPRAIFAALERITVETVGTMLFTAMTFDMTRMRGLRIYSGNEVAYPSGGWKDVTPGIWVETVLMGKRPFAALSIDEIAVVFPDFELIRSLGCESAMNLPVVVAGKVIGTLNLLHEKGYYTPDRVAAAAAGLLPFATIAFLTASEMRSRSAAV
ncbi:MAG TPA: GAF domain-containing protein [Bauldia sp.]|nr:GAF domain-containing protein [Bauldia sp.]